MIYVLAGFALLVVLMGAGLKVQQAEVANAKTKIAAVEGANKSLQASIVTVRADCAATSAKLQRIQADDVKRALAARDAKAKATAEAKAQQAVLNHDDAIISGPPTTDKGVACDAATATLDTLARDSLRLESR